MNADFKLDEAEARRVSPLFWPAPKGRVFDAVVGAAELPRILAARAAGHGRHLGQAPASRPATRRSPGKNHFTVVDAMTDPQSAMTEPALRCELAHKALG